MEAGDVGGAPEAWRPVVGWERMYEVSDRGRVKSYHRSRNGIILRQHGDYPQVVLSWGAESSRRNVAHLVVEAFIGPRPDGLVVCHNDGDPSNSALGNLRYDTQANNLADQIAHGTLARGLRRARCKNGHALTEENTRVSERASRVTGRTTKLYTCRTCEREYNRAYYATRTR